MDVVRCLGKGRRDRGKGTQKVGEINHWRKIRLGKKKQNFKIISSINSNLSPKLITLPYP